MTAAEYKAKIAALGCIMAPAGFGGECSGRVELHHPREGQGLAQRASDWLVTPLCFEHHRGDLGIHNQRSFYQRTKLDEIKLLALVIEESNQ